MRRPSAEAMRVLRCLSLDEPPERRWWTRSEWGGHVAVLYALRRRGLIDEHDKVTEAGQAALDREDEAEAAEQAEMDEACAREEAAWMAAEEAESKP